MRAEPCRRQDAISSSIVTQRQPHQRVAQRAVDARTTPLSARQAESRRPMRFAWGFWYAWVLIIGASGLIYGVVLPGIYPLMTLFFATRLVIERCATQGGACSVLGCRAGGVATRCMQGRAQRLSGRPAHQAARRRFAEVPQQKRWALSATASRRPSV